MKEKINGRQAGIIAFFSVLANKFLLLPSLMYKQTGVDAIFSLLILFLLDIFSLVIFVKLKRDYPNCKLFDLLSKKITKFFAVIIFIIFAVYFLIKSILIIDIVYAYLKKQVYQEDFFWIAVIAIIPVVNHGVVKGTRVMSRTMELFFVLILIGYISCLAFSLFTPLSAPVFFTNSIQNILSSVYKNIFSFGDFLILYLLMDKISLKKEDSKKLFSFSIFAMLLIAGLFVIYYCKYQVTSFMHNNALSDVLVFSVQFNAIGRLDIISMLTIMFLTTFQLEIFCYGFCDSLTNVFPLMTKVYSIFIFDILALLIYDLYLGNYDKMIYLFSNAFVYLALFINFLFPLICFFLCNLKGKNNLENNAYE